MSELTFRFENGKVQLVRGDNKKELPRDSLLEVCQLVLGHLADNRDYSAVTSVRKLLRIIDLECEPDESDEEKEVEEEKPAPKPVAKPVPRKTPARRPAPAKKPAVKEEDSDEDDSDDE